jgi:iron-sulfur cluster assembly protein
MGEPVLALTTNATTVIKDLTTQPQIPDGSGLRIAPSPDGTGELQLSLQPEPAPGDEVIDDQGARVFLEPAAANLLADQTLDAQVSEAGAGFYLTAQG